MQQPIVKSKGEDGRPEEVQSLGGKAQGRPIDPGEEAAVLHPAEPIGRLRGLSLFAVRDLASVSEIWRGFQFVASYTPFQDIDWSVAWLHAAKLGESYQPLVVLGYDEEQLCLIMPLALSTKYGVRKLSWLAQPINDYNAPLLHPDFAQNCSKELVEKIFEVVIKTHTQIDLLDFRQQPAKIGNLKNPFIGANVQPSSCDAHLINLRPGWKPFFTEMRNSKSRKRLRDKENRLSRSGKLQFRCEKDPTERRRLIRLAIRWKVEQLSASGDYHSFSPDTKEAGAGSTVERTLLALCDVPEMRHKMRVEGLFLAGEPVALTIAMVTGDNYSVFITAHSGGPSSQNSPGKILLVKTIQLACRAGCTKFDLLAGDEEYKLSWCDETTHLWSQVHALTPKGKLVAPVIRAARLAKKKLKQNPRLLDLAKSMNKRRLMLS